jgi:hypothetical protein
MTAGFGREIFFFTTYNQPQITIGLSADTLAREGWLPRMIWNEKIGVVRLGCDT